MYQKIGIMGALPKEIELIEAHLTHVKKETYASIEYCIGIFKNHEIILCCAGMGKTNAASVAQVLITKYNIDALIFNGIAGNLNPHLHIGDVVIGELLCYHDAQDDMLVQSAPFISSYPASATLVNYFAKSCKNMNINYIIGKIATGDQFVDDSNLKQTIAKNTNADCVEMEGAAVAQVALRNNTPFVVLRAISDNADTSIEVIRQDESFNIERYADNATAITLNFLQNL